MIDALRLPACRLAGMCLIDAGNEARNPRLLCMTNKAGASCLARGSID